MVQIIMKYFGEYKGKVTMGGVDIQKIDKRWLREQIGYVGQ